MKASGGAGGTSSGCAAGACRGGGLGTTLARGNGQVVRRETKYESADWFPGGGFGGGRDYHGTGRGVPTHAASDKPGEHARGWPHNGAIQRRNSCLQQPLFRREGGEC